MDPIANASKITSANRVLHTNYKQEKQGNPLGTLMLARSEMLPWEVWNKTLKKGTKKHKVTIGGLNCLPSFSNMENIHDSFSFQPC
jgi:hypothetical protein